MEDIFIGLILFAFSIAVWAVVGHLIWCAGAGFIRLLSGQKSPSRTVKAGECPVCQCQLEAANMLCTGCGWRGDQPRQAIPWFIALRQIHDLATQGKIDPLQATAVREAAQEQLRKALFETPGTQPQARRPESTTTHLSTLPRPERTPPAPVAFKGLRGTPVLPVPAIPPEVPPSAVPFTTTPESLAPTPSQGDIPLATLSPAPETGPSSTAFSADPVFPTEPPPSHLELDARVARYQEALQHRAASEAAATSLPVNLAPPPPPRRSWNEWFAAFMEEKHIRWGELVGGLLIVCCSIALVISFWSEIAERPLLKFGVFNGVTAALFGLGLHAQRRWNLPTTSQGMLHIATFLTPLNFLAIAAFTEGRGAGPVVIVGEVISIAAFTSLLYFAGRYLVGSWTLALTGNVICASVLQLFIRRWLNADASSSLVYLFASINQMIYLAGSLGPLLRVARKPEVSDHDAARLCKLVGLTSFASIIPLGLLLFKTAQWGVYIHLLSPWFALGAFPALASGLLLWFRGEKTSTSWPAVGTFLTVLGGVALIGGIGLAWPQPLPMVGNAVVAFVLLTFIAIRFRIAEAHPVAAGAATIVLVLGFQMLFRELPWTGVTGRQTFGALMTSSSANLLAIMVSLYAIAAWFWRRSDRRDDSRMCLWASVGLAVASLGLLTWKGFAVDGDPNGATLMYAFYATLVAAATIIMRRPEGAWFTGGLVLASLIQGIAYRYNVGTHESEGWSWAFLVHAVLMVAAGWITWALDRSRGTMRLNGWLHHPRIKPWASWGILSTTVVSGLILYRVLELVEPWPLMQIEIVTALWLALSILGRSPPLFALFQSTAIASLFILVERMILPRLFGNDAVDTQAFHPYRLQWYGITLALFGLFWMGLRALLDTIEARANMLASEITERPPVWKETDAILSPPWYSIDRIGMWTAVMIGVLLGVIGVIPGISQELMPRDIATVRQVVDIANAKVAGIPHAFALHTSSWLLVGLCFAGVLGSLREEYRYVKLGGIAACTAAICMLAAGRYESQVASASAYRWFTTLAFLAGSALVWYRLEIKNLLPLPPSVKQRINWRVKPSVYSWHAFSWLLIFFGLATAPLVVNVSISAMQLRTIESREIGMLYVSIAVAVVLLFTYGMIAVLRTILSSNVDGANRLAFATGSGRSKVNFQHAALALGLAPLLILLVYLVASALRQHPITGPDPTSLFHRVGLAVSYGIPLCLVTATIFGHAIHLRSNRIAFGAGILVLACTTTLYLLMGAPRMGLGTWVRVSQLAAISAAICGMAWMGFLRWRSSQVGTRGDQSGPLGTYLMIGMGFAIAPLCGLMSVLFLFPTTPLPLHDHAGWIGFGSVVLMLVAFVLWSMRSVSPSASMRSFDLSTSEGRTSVTSGWKAWGRTAFKIMPPGFWVGGVYALTSLAALSMHRWNATSLTSYDAWMVLHGIVGFLVVITWGSLRSRGGTTWGTPWFERAGAAWNHFVMTELVLLGLRSTVDRSPNVFWNCFPLIVAAILAGFHAALAARRRYLVFASACIQFATTFVWVQLDLAQYLRPNDSAGFAFLWIHLAALGFPTVLWFWIEKRWIRPNKPADRQAFSWHRMAASIGMVLLSLMTAASVFGDFIGQSVFYPPALAWIAFLAIAVAMATCLWDSAARFATFGLYVLGLVGVSLFVDGFNLPLLWLVWIEAVILSAYGLLTSYLYSRRAGLRRIATALCMPEREGIEGPVERWLIPANLLLAVGVSLLGFWGQGVLQVPTQRIAAAQSILVQVLAMGWLARGRDSLGLRQFALAFGALGAVALGWAVLDPQAPSFWIHGVVASAAAVGLSVVLYGFGLNKWLSRENPWSIAASKLVPSLAVVAMSILVFELGMEAVLYLNNGSVAISPGAIGLVSVTWLGLSAACFAAAILPGRDPLGLNDTWKQAYVYGGELILGLLFLHIRVTMPYLFTGNFQKYWPLIVMAIAFLGVGLSEAFSRRGPKILSRPLERTGVLLPVLPVIGFWIAPAQVHYSFVMLAVGALYGVMSAMRRSFGFGLLAALAVNGGLWFLLHESEGLGLLEHPQLWLIPPSLCALVAAHLNRKRLSESQMTSTRYIASTLIYTASTADIFLNGVAQAPWLPLVLAGLSIAGIAMGIALRIRAFLFLGVSFLGLALLTVIWHAAVDLHQTWIWFLSGIIAGAAIIAMFAVFEKKRQQILEMVDRLKQWQA